MKNKSLQKINHELPVQYDNLSVKERREVREQYMKKQHNKCIFCNNTFNEGPSSDALSLKLDLSLFPQGFLKYPVHLQHNHYTGLTEGAAHAYCNGLMWQYEGR